MKHAFFALFLLLTSLSYAQSSNELSLDDLSFSAEETKVTISPELKLIMDDRHDMLEKHQYLSFGAAALMTAAMLTGESSKAQSDAHKYLGIAGGLTYYVASAYAIFTPEIPGAEAPRGNILWHRRLAWVHGPAMVLAPILGYLANKKYVDGQKPSGIEKVHSSAAKIGYWAFMASFATVTFEF